MLFEVKTLARVLTFGGTSQNSFLIVQTPVPYHKYTCAYCLELETLKEVMMIFIGGRIDLIKSNIQRNSASLKQT